MIAPDFPLNEELLRRLPLPLAQLYRRAFNTKTALDRHLTAYYLWELGQGSVILHSRNLRTNELD